MPGRESGRLPRGRGIRHSQGGCSQRPSHGLIYTIINFSGAGFRGKGRAYLASTLFYQSLGIHGLNAATRRGGWLHLGLSYHRLTGWAQHGNPIRANERRYAQLCLLPYRAEQAHVRWLKHAWCRANGCGYDLECHPTHERSNQYEHSYKRC